jgi:transposase
MIESGHTQAGVARRLGVSREAVRRWWNTYERGGKSALLAKPRRGTRPKLARRLLQRLPKMLERGPTAYGFSGEIWTTVRIAKLIRDEFGVSYHKAQVARLLGEMGFSWQKPQKRAAERDEAAVQQWLRETWPAIKKTPRTDEQ